MTSGPESWIEIVDVPVQVDRGVQESGGLQCPLGESEVKERFIANREA